MHYWTEWATNVDAILHNVADSYSVPSWVIGASKVVFIFGAVVASIVMSIKNPRIIPTIKISEIPFYMGKTSSKEELRISWVRCWCVT